MFNLVFSLLAGAAAFYGLVLFRRHSLQRLDRKYVGHDEDERDTDERRIAGEDTSEVALDYLKNITAIEK